MIQEMKRNSLAESDHEAGIDSMKFCCQWISVSVNTSVQFHTSQLLRDLGVGLGLDQCEDTITLTLVPGYNELNYNDQIYYKPTCCFICSCRQ